MGDNFPGPVGKNPDEKQSVFCALGFFGYLGVDYFYE